MKNILFLLLLAVSGFSQTAIIENAECEIGGKSYSKAKLVYEFSKPIKVKNMNFKDIGNISGVKLTVTGKDDKGDPVQKVWLGKPPKVKYKEPKEEKPKAELDETVVK